ncbi:MAG: BMP family ABC transporter substrate-binding protein [SAR324 cluster bacterium]|nr:BMP family ABC transporter substrate-binding protein [SAR324 cluster bacterium]
MKKIFILSIFLMSAGIVNSQTKVALVFDAGGKNDRSFNQAAWEGAKQAEKSFGIILKDVEPPDSSAVQEAIRNFASQGFDLIIGVGFANAPAIKTVAKEFPKISFAIVDSRVDLPNVASLEFKEQEGSFLVGVIAGMTSYNVKGKKAVGFIGGMDIPLIHKFEVGFTQGVKAVNSDIKVLVNYVGNTPAAWNDPAKGKEISNAQIAKGATVIYSAAGGSGGGMFDAIKNKNGKKDCASMKESCVYAIGVDSNQNYIVPGQVLTSMLKRVDVAVYNTIRQMNSGSFKGGSYVFGLSSNGVGYALDKYNKSLISDDTIAKVAQYRKKIIAKTLKVDSTR